MALARDLQLSITTKSDLVTRDIDLLRRIGERSSVQVSITVTTLDRRLARILEHRAPTPELRLKALRTLRHAGIAAGVSLAPIMPDITDSRANLEAVITAAREHSASHIFGNVLFLKPLARQAFFPFLEQHFPHLVRRYKARFARSAFLDRAYKDRIFAMVAELKGKYGITDQKDGELESSVHEAEAAQLPLLQLESETRSIPCIGTPPTASRVGGTPDLRYSRRSQTHPTPRSGTCD
jgi:DNA repair photolyase